MLPETWVEGPKVNELGMDDGTKEFVLVTNGRCVLDHTSSEAYAKSHAKTGCLMRPCEGLVFQVENDKLVTWAMMNVSGRDLVCVSPDVRDTLMPQYQARLDEIAKEAKLRG